jgi:hypothetical protein
MFANKRKCPFLPTCFLVVCSAALGMHAADATRLVRFARSDLFSSNGKLN